MTEYFCVYGESVFYLKSCLPAGGADEHAGKDETGAGCDQAASLLHTAISTGEGHPPHKHEARAQKTAGGDP